MLQAENSIRLHNGVFRVLSRECLRCGSGFKTPYTRKLYCSRKCYMDGIQERSTKWLKTEEGHNWKVNNQRKNARQRRIRALIALGGKCIRCGYKDLRALHIDHVNSDGNLERKSRKTVESKLWIGKDIDKSRYQILCANCNWIKRIEEAEVGLDDYNSYLKDIEKTITLSKK